MKAESKNKKDVAHRDDWKTEPMPEQHETFVLNRSFSEEQMNVLRCGNVPQAMEDKWFWYMEGSTLWAHRSWTGYCIYRIDFKEDNNHLVTVNRNPEQYACTDVEQDIESLNKLLDWWAQTPYDHYSEWLSETHDALKKPLGGLLSLILALSVMSCTLFINQQTPKGYVRYAVYLLDRDGLYADRPEWKEKRVEVLKSAKTIADLDEAHRLVQEAADVAGGKHSFIIPPVRDTASYQEFAPEVEMLEGNIIQAILPGHTGVKVSDSLYIHTVFDYLQEHLDARGVIVDLRSNTGGNMYPMIASVSPLLPDGIVLKFKSRKRTVPIWLDYVTGGYQIAPEGIGKFPASTPVAVLTSEKTGSSGEATLISFLGMDNVKTFGGPTAGYPSGNVTHTLSDGYLFAITRSAEIARTGEIYCEDPILPDVITETPLEDAIAWIESMNQ